MTPAAVLAILALLAPGASGERATARGWYVRFDGDPWAYSPADDDEAPRQRTRPATFLHVGDDGTAIELRVGVIEDTTSRAGRPTLAAEDGFSLWSGAWRRGAGGGLELALEFRLASGVAFAELPGTRNVALGFHGRHLVAPEGPLVPLGFAYPVDGATLRKQLFEACCGGGRRDPACRTVRR